MTMMTAILGTWFTMRLLRSTLASISTKVGFSWPPRFASANPSLVATTCPLLWDVLGFPGSFDYVPNGANVYFNLTDVQTAINAPVQEWDECSTIDVFVNGTDTSAPSALSVLPGVIERADRVILGHGLLDFILQYNGTLVAIQNMTFNGAQV